MLKVCQTLSSSCQYSPFKVYVRDVDLPVLSSARHLSGYVGQDREQEEGAVYQELHGRSGVRSLLVFLDLSLFCCISPGDVASTAVSDQEKEYSESTTVHFLQHLKQNQHLKRFAAWMFQSVDTASL